MSVQAPKINGFRRNGVIVEQMDRVADVVLESHTRVQKSSRLVFVANQWVEKTCSNVLGNRRCNLFLGQAN